MKSRKGLIRLFAGLALGGVCLYFALRKLSLADFADRVSQANWGLLALGVLMLGCGYAVRTIRWWLMLREINPSLKLGPCVAPFLGSFALNNVLPFRAGDVARLVAFRERTGVSAAPTLAAMTVERLMDLASLLLVFFVGLSGARAGRVPESFITACGVGLALSLAMLALALVMPRACGRAAHALGARLKAGGLGQRALAGFEGLMDATSRIVSPLRSLSLLGLSFVAWAFEGATFACVLAALGGAGTSSALAPYFALATGTLSALLPGTPGNVGTFDLFTSLGLQAYGANASASTAFALVVHAVVWLPLTVVGLALLAFARSARVVAPTPGT